MHRILFVHAWLALTFIDAQSLLVLSPDSVECCLGCSIHLISRSHKLGCINPDHHSGFLTEDQAREYCDQNQQVCLELQPGDLALLHNHTIHQVRARLFFCAF